MRKFISLTAAAAMMAAAGLAVPAAAQTGGGIGSVIDCDASGNRQAYGAILGGLAGAVVGNNVSRGKDAPLVGAVAGAAAGSYIGCQQQRNIAASQGRGLHYATTTVNVRAGPSTGYGAVGQLRRGDRVTVMGYEGNWAHVNLGANRYGFVSASYLAPTNR